VLALDDLDAARFVAVLDDEFDFTDMTGAVGRSFRGERIRSAPNNGASGGREDAIEEIHGFLLGLKG